MLLHFLLSQNTDCLKQLFLHGQQIEKDLHALTNRTPKKDTARPINEKDNHETFSVLYS
jgi:hypothetical protein